MKRYLIFAAILGLAGVLAFFAVGTITGTGPASAHVEGLTVNPKGAVLHGGSQVSISGTLQCTAGETGFLSVSVSQLVHGQVLASAFGSAPPFTCSGLVQTWTVTALTFGIGLKPGPANVHVDLSTSGFDGGGFQHTSATVKLQPASELPPVSPPVSPPASPPSSALAAALSGPVGVATMGVFTSILMVGAAAGFLRLLDTGGRRETD